jgi:preprotein translocase YajC subunit
MNLLLDIGSTLAQYWPMILIVVMAVALLVPTYLRQKKEMKNRQELNDTIKVGTKIVTTAGVYGVVESMCETSDGVVVVISTGDEKHPSTMTIHINAIMGIDNKTVTKESKSSKKVTKVVEVEEEESSEDVVEEIAEKVQKQTKKTTKKTDK